MLDGDRFLFFRRLAAPQAHVFTDINPGGLDAAQAAWCFAEFVRKTGGWPENTFLFDAIGYQEDSEADLQKQQEAVVSFIQNALGDHQIASVTRRPLRHKIALEILL